MNATLAKCEGRASTIHGNGLFANAEYAVGEQILSLSGQLVPIDTLSDAYLAGGAWVALLPDKVLLAKDAPEACLINHSKKANAALDTRKWRVVATRGIKPGQEIVIDYTQSAAAARLQRIRERFV